MVVVGGASSHLLFVKRTAASTFLLTEYHCHGDRSARERVIEQHLPLARALARRFSRSADQVEDLVQDASIGLIKAVDGFAVERGNSLGAYAVPMIVGELLRSTGRRSWPVGMPRAAERAPVAVPLDDELTEEPTAAAELDRSEDRLVLRAGIRTLSRRERRVVVLRYYRDWSQQRIADELGLSQPQVSRILAGALAKLRDELALPPARHCATRHRGLR